MIRLRELGIDLPCRWINTNRAKLDIFNFEIGPTIWNDYNGHFLTCDICNKQAIKWCCYMHEMNNSTAYPYFDMCDGCIIVCHAKINNFINKYTLLYYLLTKSLNKDMASVIINISIQG